MVNSLRLRFVHANSAQFVVICILRKPARNHPVLSTKRCYVISMTHTDSAAVCATVNHAPMTVESFAEGYTESDVDHAVTILRVYRCTPSAIDSYIFIHGRARTCFTELHNCIAEDVFKIVSLQSTTFPRIFLVASNHSHPPDPSLKLLFSFGSNSFSIRIFLQFYLRFVGV